MRSLNCKTSGAGFLSSPILEARRVTRSFGKKTVLTHVDLEIQPGEVVCVEGENGAGKTTLFRILSTVMLPSTGTIQVEGMDASKRGGEVRRKIGYMPAAENTFFPRLTGLQNLELFAGLAGLTKPELHRRLDRWKALGPLNKALSTRYLFCSTGMKQSLSFCRALIHDPLVALLDEPMKSLDDATTNSMIHWIEEFVEKKQRSVLFVSHVQAIRQRLSCRQVKIQEGRLVTSS